MEPRVRLAFTIGYIGRYFHGSQIQPDVETVQGELIRVFRKLKWLDPNETSHNLVLSSRTDAGVNVRRNGGTVKLAKSLWESLNKRKMVRAIDDQLCDGLVFLDVKEVAEDWNPRLAIHRIYRYRIEGIQGWSNPGKKFAEWLKLFVGTYDARNFARLEEGKNPIRKIYSCTPWEVNGRIVGFEIIGEAFLWNQVRRTAMALHRLTIGELTQQEIKDAIDHPETPVDFGVAPPEWLVLWDVVWPNFTHDESTDSTFTFTELPQSDYIERTMISRWEKGASLEMESMLYHEWSKIGKLPYIPHDSK